MTRHEANQLLGPWMTTALVVGSMIGAGIFMLPVSLEPLGANAIFGWLVSGFGALTLAYSLARLGESDGAGIQAYIERSFGAALGFLVTWSFWVSSWTASAALAIATASAVARIADALNTPGTIATIAIAVIVLLTAVNAAGARSAGRVAVVTTLIKILPLIAVVLILLLGATRGEPLERLSEVPINFDHVASAAALTLFALTGFENATAPVGKIRDPARNIPRAILGGTAFVGGLYLLSSTSVMLLLPGEDVINSPAPYADAIGRSWGESAALITAAAVAISAFGCLNGGILVTGELGYSMASRGDLPAALARTHGNTPIVSLIFGAGLAILLVLFNSNRTTAGLFTFLILMSTSATLVLYAVGACAALRKRNTAIQSAIILAGIGFALFAFYGAGMEANGWVLVLLLAGLAIRTIMRRQRGSSRMAAVNPAVPRE